MTELLAASGLTRSFRTTLAVDRVDFAIGAGARHAVIGPNGAGKTTLLNLLSGALAPTAGHIRLAGNDITRKPPAARARLGLARTFQTPAVFGSLSALDNLVAAGWRRGSSRSGLTRIGLQRLGELGLGECADRPAHALSHGQRRLLEIAMALSGHPRMLLLDEPAAGLGDADLDRLVETLHRLPPDMAVLLVEHNQDVVAAVSETVTVLHHGRVLATGTPQEISKDPAVTEVYLGGRGEAADVAP